MIEITKPGIYADVVEADYFADPCPKPSLTQSIAKILLAQSPLHAWCAHPRLGLDDDEPERYVGPQAIGTAAHKMLIGRGRELAVCEFDDWRTNVAKKASEEAIGKGLIPILRKHHDCAVRMAETARAQIAANTEAADALCFGRGEVMLAWQEHGIWCRALVDWLHDDLRTVDDYKTVSRSAAPDKIPMLMVDAGWDVQAAMQERGLNALDPKGAGRRKFRFVVQEQERPFALLICELPESVLTMGRKKLAMAIGIWHQCTKDGHWPGYPRTVLRPTYPEWRERQWLDRELEQADKVPSDILAAG